MALTHTETPAARSKACLVCLVNTGKQAPFPRLCSPAAQPAGVCVANAEATSFGKLRALPVTDMQEFQAPKVYISLLFLAARATVFHLQILFWICHTNARGARVEGRVEHRGLHQCLWLMICSHLIKTHYGVQKSPNQKVWRASSESFLLYFVTLAAFGWAPCTTRSAAEPHCFSAFPSSCMHVMQGFRAEISTWVENALPASTACVA